MNTGSEGPKARGVEEVRALGSREVDVQTEASISKGFTFDEDNTAEGIAGRQILATLVVAEQLAGIRETLEKIALTGALGLLATAKVGK